MMPPWTTPFSCENHGSIGSATDAPPSSLATSSSRSARLNRTSPNGSMGRSWIVYGQCMQYEAISLLGKFAKFSDHYRPRVVAEMNDYQFKVVRVQGDFVWHSHEETDETFLVLDGELTIDFRDGAVVLGRGDMFVVPKGKEHKPIAVKECKLLLIEPRGTVNTGKAGGPLTAPDDVWV